MESMTLNPPPPAAQENRRAARVRKVRPVAFVARSADAEPAMRTVTANISRGGMLLVTRQDSFPPAGSSVLLMPFDVSAQTSPDATSAIQGRIVYTRFSPRAQLRFAGLKFEQELPARAAQLLGIDGRPDSVADAVTTLEELEAFATAPQASARIEFNNIEIAAAPERSAIAFEAPIAATPLIPSMPTGESFGGGPVGRVREALATTRVEFIRATGAFMEAWGESQLRDTLGARHALARAKGVDGLREMKREWIGLRGNFVALAEAEFEQSGAWPRAGHLDGATNPYYNTEQDQPRAAVMQSLRMLAGLVGRLLVRHGFDDVGAGSNWALASDRGTLTFTGAMAFSDAMREALIRAGQLHAELLRSLEQASMMRENEARADALRIWDRA